MFTWLKLLQHAAQDWLDDKAPQLGAALAFYTVFSLAPVLVIAVAVASFFLDQAVVQAKLTEQVQALVGNQAALAVTQMLEATSKSQGSVLAVVVGAVGLFLGATGVVLQLKAALNTIWEVPPPAKSGFGVIVRERLLSLAMVLAIGFLLLVSLLVSTILAGLSNAYHDYLPGPDVIAHLLDLLVSFLITSLLFAAIFKFLPDAQVAWRDVWFGSFVTGLLFTLGKYLIGMYLGAASVSSAYGAAGSFAILLLWTYYSAQILFFGAELTQVYAEEHGSRIQAIASEKNQESSVDPARKVQSFPSHL